MVFGRVSSSAVPTRLGARVVAEVACGRSGGCEGSSGRAATDGGSKRGEEEGAGGTETGGETAGASTYCLMRGT